MTAYTVETMTRRELRNCYNRYCWAVILLFPLSLLLARVLIQIYVTAASPALRSDPIWSVAIPSIINAVSCYVPATALFLVMLRCFPRAEKLPVDHLDQLEFLQALAFTLGAGFLFNALTLNLIELLQHATGMETFNRVTAQDALSPIWDQVIFSVLLPAVCEELIFRRLLLDRLRPLGDVSAVFLSALAFSLFHSNLYQMLYVFVLGAFFAMVVLLTGSIRDTILLHICINGLTTLRYAFPSPWFHVLHSLLYGVCAVLAVFLFVKKRKQIRLEPGPLSFSARDKRRACLGSAWFYVMLATCFYGSIVVIFR